MSLNGGSSRDSFTVGDRALLNRLAALLDRGAPGSQHSPDAQQLRFTVFQSAHGFAAKDPVYYDATGSASWKKALATDTSASLLPQGIVESVGTNLFTVVLVGFIGGLSGLTQGTLYYLANAGGLTSTAPTRAIPMLKALSTTTGIVLRANAPIDVSSMLALVTYGSPSSYTFSTGTHNFTAGKKWALIEIIGGGGGGGGGSAGTGGNSYAGGGGGGGEKILFMMQITVSSVNYSIGAATSTASVGADGANGNATTCNGISADGGRGGTSNFGGDGGDGGQSDTGMLTTTSEGIQIRIPGAPGQPGRVEAILSTTSYTSRGGIGGGGKISGTANPGRGGDGGNSGSGGGAGQAGRVRIWEA